MTRWVLLLGVVLALAGCQPLPPGRPTSTSTSSTVALAQDRPISAVTPGVILTTSATDVCTPGWASRHRRSLTDRQETLVLRAYGLRADQKVAEWDHLVALELGGGNGVKNIWPELSPDDRRLKDRLENRLHDAVCDGRLDLKVAQERIRTYWDDPLW